MKISKIDKYRALKLKPEQHGQISSEDKIHTAMEDDSCMGFDVFKDEKQIGFARLREYEPGCFFLWDFIIHRSYQHRGNGHALLRLLLKHMKKDVWCENHHNHLILPEIKPQKNCMSPLALSKRVFTRTVTYMK